MNRNPAVYILTNRYNGTLYIGVTNDLIKRIGQHRQGFAEGFSKKYGLKQLVYFEQYEDMATAILREKQLKAGSRAKKIALIDRINPDWRDLYPEIVG